MKCCDFQPATRRAVLAFAALLFTAAAQAQTAVEQACFEKSAAKVSSKNPITENEARTLCKGATDAALPNACYAARSQAIGRDAVRPCAGWSVWLAADPTQVAGVPFFAKDVRDVDVKYGSVYAIGGPAEPGGYGVWQLDSLASPWFKVDGGAVRVAVDPTGQPWVVNAAGDIFRRVPGSPGVSAANQRWVMVSTASVKAQDVAVAMDGSVWIVDTAGLVRMWVGNLKWTEPQGGTQVRGATRVTAISTQPAMVEVTMSDGRLWHVNTTTGAFTAAKASMLTGTHTEAALDVDGTQWFINDPNHVLRSATRKAAVPVTPFGAASAANAPGTFPAGTKIALRADNGMWMGRCRGCQTTINRSLEDTIVLSDKRISPTSTFEVLQGPGDSIMLKADTGFMLGYCNGCIQGGSVPDFIGVQSTAADNSYNKFQLSRLNNGKYSLKAANGKYVARCNGCSPSFAPQGSRGNVVTAHVVSPTEPWAQWTIEIDTAR